MSAAISVRVDVEPDRGVLPILTCLLLELGHAVQPADAATQLKIQASSAWPETWLWLNTMCRVGSMPEAMKAAVTSRVLCLSSSGVLKHGDGVEVDHAVKAIVLGLKRHESA